MVNYYILVGDNRTWRTAFSKNIWGFTEKTKKLWEAIEKGDVVCFYVKKPTKKIIGFGIIYKKFQKSEIFWPDEIISKKVLWPYRMKFKPIHIIDNWDDGLEPPSNIILNQGRKKISKMIFLDFINSIEVKWGLKKKDIELISQ